MKLIASLLTLAGSAAIALAHYTAGNEFAVTNIIRLPVVVEKKGPVRAPKPQPRDPATPVSGQGFWKFVAATNLVPVPASITAKQLKGAHGTIVVDKRTDIAYWGLQGVGWIAFSNQLRDSWVVAGNPAFTNGNLHGADLLPRGAKAPLIAAADNVAGKIYLTDTSFQAAETVAVPDFAPYATNKTFRPTDVAFVDDHELWAVDGYAKNEFLPLLTQPLRWRGESYGGTKFSTTLHGVTYDKAHGDLLFSARPEGLLKRVDHHDLKAKEILGLPPGTLLCDVDIWGDYALCACLDGPNNTPGPLHIVNLKKRTLVATIQPKTELGYADVDHIHDAAWYVTGKGDKQEVYILFTNWNPGGVHALKLVNILD